VMLWESDGAVGATFQGPARAIRAAQRVIEAGEVSGRPVRAVVHTGECMYRPDGGVTGAAVCVASGLLDEARDGEVHVTRTVRDLVAGAGFRFEERGMMRLLDEPGEMAVYGVVR
jgi:class 3 adenylate cyclase